MDAKAPKGLPRKREAPDTQLKTQPGEKRQTRSKQDLMSVVLPGPVPGPARPARRAPAFRGCGICIGSFESHHFPTQSELPATCAHCDTTCKTCIGRSLASDIDNKPFEKVGCPVCRRRWNYSYIKQFSTKHVMSRYETLGMLRVVRAIPNFIWCLSPKCTFGQIHHEGDREPIVTCAGCGFRMCYIHRSAWHSGLTCVEYDAARAADETRKRTAKEEEKTAAELERHTKLCPQCGVRIIKVDGCNHMTCKSCCAISFVTYPYSI